MFEFEIMLVGYTVVLGSATVAISKRLSRRNFNKISNELNELKTTLRHAKVEIEKLKKLKMEKLQYEEFQAKGMIN